MKNRILFIYNPYSGKKKIKTYFNGIVKKLSRHKSDLIIEPTKCSGHAETLVGDYKEKAVDLICCSGGDGTLHEVVNGVMKNDVKAPICYIPAGSTNDFGASLHIPKDMLKASAQAHDGYAFPIDIGSFNKDYFVYTACFGIFTKTSYATSQSLKNVLGHFAYIVSGMKEFINIPRYYMRVEYDGHVIEDYFIFGSVTSSESVGGFKGIAGKPLFDDGYFELVLIRDGSFLELPGLAISMLKGDMSHKRIIYAKVKNVKFTSSKDVAWCMDGEFAGDQNEVEIAINKKAVSLMVPKKAMPLISSVSNLSK